jgi:hypothetical protein
MKYITNSVWRRNLYFHFDLYTHTHGDGKSKSNFFICIVNQALMLSIRLLSYGSVMFYCVPNDQLFLLPHIPHRYMFYIAASGWVCVDGISLVLHLMLCSQLWSDVDLHLAVLFTFNINCYFCFIFLFSFYNSSLVLTMASRTWQTYIYVYRDVYKAKMLQCTCIAKDIYELPMSYLNKLNIIHVMFCVAQNLATCHAGHLWKWPWLMLRSLWDWCHDQDWAHVPLPVLMTSCSTDWYTEKWTLYQHIRFHLNLITSTKDLVIYCLRNALSA